MAFAFAIFLIGCQSEPSKQTTQNGYEYLVHVKNDGTLPNPGDYVYFHGHIRNGDSVFYTSRTQPATPRLQIPVEPIPNRQPSPVEDVLRNMSVGDSVTVFIPLDTITNRPRGFENEDVMLYDVVCMDIKSSDEYQAALQEEREATKVQREAAQARAEEIGNSTKELAVQYGEGKLADQLKTTESGLKYIVHEEGTGPQPKPGQGVAVHYYGILTDGKMFDNSFQRGLPFEFPIGQGRVIPGWDEGIALLKEGAKATLFIPYEMAYGEAGSPPTIPPKAELIFYVELNKVN